MQVEKESKAVSEKQLVVFNLSGETYGVDISAVHEIIRMQSITNIPRTPDFVEGVINLRGRIIPVIDLRKRFGLEQGETTQLSRIIVVEVDGITVGMIVDAVSEVLRLPANSIEPPPPVISGVAVEYIHGVGKLDEQLIILLDLNKVLEKEEKKQLEKESFQEAAAVREG